MQKVYEALDRKGFKVDKKYVIKKLDSLTKKLDLTKFIL